MRYFLSRIAAVGVVAGLAAAVSPATAAPMPSLKSAVSETGSVELVGHHHHHGHWQPYRYNYGFYGYHYRPYYGLYRPWYGPWYRSWYYRNWW